MNDLYHTEPEIISVTLLWLHLHEKTIVLPARVESRNIFLLHKI